MKKFLIKLLIMGMIVFAGLQMVDISLGDDQVRADAPVEAAFMATGAELMEINHNGWARINETLLSEDQVMGVIYNAAQFLGLPYENIEIEKYPQFCSGKMQVKADESTFVEISCQTMGYNHSEQEFAETYLMVNTVEIGERGQNDWRQKIKEVLNEFDSKENVSTLYSGVISGCLNQQEMEECIQKAWQLTEAKEIEGISENDLVSMTGYTKKIHDYIELGDERMNMNIALNIDENNEQTHVMVASPLITTEY